MGIELGSTRIKSVLIGEDHRPIASGVMNGKIDWKMEYGHIHWKMFGRVCKAVIVIC